jgi:hypothetical protein
VSLKVCRVGAVVAGAALGTGAALGQGWTPWEWSNVRDYPADLQSTGDAWSAIRIDARGFESYRIAAEDFQLEYPTRIDRITFYSVHIDPPNILGGDWYVCEDDGRGAPGPLLAAGQGEALTQVPLRIINTVFGTEVYANVMEPAGLELPAGRYFLAVRTHQGEPLGGGKPNNVALSTRWGNGNHRALWNFAVMADGSVMDSWVPLEMFNLVREQEWALRLEGEQDRPCYADCDGNGVLDFFDFLCFQDCFLAGDPRCDCDGNGVMDFFDFLCFQDAFLAGCP